MSGGSLDYAYYKIETLASEIRDRKEATALHRAFASHLMKVAKAAHDIEWLYSGDYGPEGAVDSINACLGDSKKAITEEIQKDLDKIKREITELEKGL
jgi:hypothetical protein